MGGVPESQQYLLVTDSAAPGQAGGCTQAELVTALAARLGSGELT